MANSTRNLSGIIRRSNGKPWGVGIVTSTLVSAWAEDDTQPGHSEDWPIASTGAVLMTLAVPTTGTVAYRFELPSGETFTANIGLEDGSEIDFEELVQGAYSVPTDIDTTLALLNARLNPAVQVLTDGATVTWDFGGYPFRNARVTLQGDRQLAITNLPATPADGRLWVFQGTGGGHTLALPTGVDNYVIEGGAGAITLSATEGNRDILTFAWDGTDLYWTYGTGFTKAP